MNMISCFGISISLVLEPWVGWVGRELKDGLVPSVIAFWKVFQLNVYLLASRWTKALH